MENKETTFLDRLILEEKELGEKIAGLNKGLNSDGFTQKVGEYQYGLLCLQHSTMLSYRRILIMRINDLKTKNKYMQYEVFFTQSQIEHLPLFLQGLEILTGIPEGELYVETDLDGEGELEQVQALVNEELLGGIRPGKPSQVTAD